MKAQQNVPQQLQEIVDRGFPEPQHLDVVHAGTYGFIDRGDAILRSSGPDLDGPQVQLVDDVGIGYCFDGSFLPIRHGAGYTLYNLMRAVNRTEEAYPSLINCYRGWDAPETYYGQEFRSVFVHPDDYYNQTGVVEDAFDRFGLTNAQFYSPEGLLNLGPRLKRIGAQAILEVQNTDYILLERLGASALEVQTAKDLQTRALEVADHTFCRSEIDRHYSVELGADPKTVSVYKGGINVEDFHFMPRLEPRHNLVFLGHMYYQPNVNALDYIVDEILPGLDASYTLTVIGIAPPDLLAKYKDPRIVFKEGVDDLDAELLKHDIALAPLREGSGTRLKVLDYLASGLPVITTALGIEGLDNRIGDYITVADDLGTYADRIKAVMADPAAYAARSVRGRQFVADTYDWSKCVDPFMQVYKPS